MKKQTVSIRAPKGFHFKISKFCETKYIKYAWKKTNKIASVYIELYKTKTHIRIGHIKLECIGSNRFETHARLDDEYHNKKLGTLMYSKAIQWALKNGFKIRSSGQSSDMAMRVWEGKSIRKHFLIKSRQNTGYTKKHFYAYPK